MLLWPKKWTLRFPASLLGIILATALNAVLHWPVAVIGAIPQTLLLADRLQLGAIPWNDLPGLIAPALTITALGAVESLLCGAVASNMTGSPPAGQSGADRAGGRQHHHPLLRRRAGHGRDRAHQRRHQVGRTHALVSIIHALALLASMFLLAPSCRKSR